MSRNRKKFTEEEIRLLASNPYTYRIRKQIVRDLGYEVEMLGARRVEGLRDHIVKESLSLQPRSRGAFLAKYKFTIFNM